jgi:hypothetical protein
MYRVIALTVAIGMTACAATTPAPQISKERFELELISINLPGQTRHIKYDKYTGEAWWASDTTWTKIQEPEVLPQSIYEIKTVAYGDSWRAIRIDKVSGRAWKNSSGKWVPFANKVSQ